MKSLQQATVLAVLLAFVAFSPAAFAETALTWHQKGLAYMKAGNYKAAVAAFTNVLAEEPRSLHAYVARGTCHSWLGQYDQAVADFSKAAEIDPRTAEIYYLRGRVYWAKGAIQQALADYTAAIALAGNKPSAYAERGRLYAATGRLDLALADYSAAIKYERGNENHYLARGLVYAKKGDNDAALADFNIALALNPASAQAYKFRGALFERKKDSQQALADFDRALELQPDDGEAYMFRGNLRRRLELYRAAVADYDKAIEHKYRKVHLAYYYKGILCEELGCPLEALRAYRAALENSPSGGSALLADNIKKRIKALEAFYLDGRETKVASWAEKDAPVSPQEKIIIQLLLRLCDAYERRDFARFVAVTVAPVTPAAFAAFVQARKDFKLHAVEVLAYGDETIKGRITYSYRDGYSNRPDLANVPAQFDVRLGLRDGRWVIAEMRKYSASIDMAQAAVAMAELLEKAKNRYGTDDLANWAGLK